MREILLLAHATTGALGVIAAVWTFVEALNVSEWNLIRVRLAALSSAILMAVTWVAGGYWYVTYYAADKTIILKSTFPIAHTFFMEAKEHAFFITLIFAFLAAIIAYTNDIVENRGARILLLWSSALVALSGFAIEGAGSLIALAVRIGLLSSGGAL